MFSGSTISYAIPLLIGAGLFLLRVDVTGYKMAELAKEIKVAKVTGWINLTAGLIFLLWKIVH